jgi:hypothetical protein
MLKLLFILFSLGLFCIQSSATDPAILCDEDAISNLNSYKQDLMNEACKFAGQYQDSILPDKSATPTGQIREGQPASFNYQEFLNSLNSVTNGFNKKDCKPQSALAAPIPYTTVMIKNTAVGEIPISVLDESQVHQIFEELSHDPQYTFKSPEEGCWARAQIMAQELEKKGIRVGKMFVEADLNVDTKDALNGKNVHWSYHVAPVVAVNGKNGIEMRVLDPSLFTEPVSNKVWVDKLLSNTKSKNRAEIYVTDRFVFEPVRDNTLRSLNEDPAHGRWHKAETVLAQQELARLRSDYEDIVEWKKKK